MFWVDLLGTPMDFRRGVLSHGFFAVKNLFLPGHLGQILCEKNSLKNTHVRCIKLYPCPILYQRITRWWFQIFFIFTPTWGNGPI